MKAARGLWLATALVAVAGYGLIVQPDERAISNLESHARILYDEANANDATVRRSWELHRIESRVDADLRRLSGQQSNEGATSSALRLLDAEAKRFNVSIRSVEPDAANMIPASSELRGTAWNVGLRGRFRDVVSLIADLPVHDVLLEVGDVALAASSRNVSLQPVLDVTLHATVYRITALSLEETHASGIER